MDVCDAHAEYCAYYTVDSLDDVTEVIGMSTCLCRDGTCCDVDVGLHVTMLLHSRLRRLPVCVRLSVLFVRGDKVCCVVVCGTDLIDLCSYAVDGCLVGDLSVGTSLDVRG